MEADSQEARQAIEKLREKINRQAMAVIERVGQVVVLVLTEGLVAAMNKFNG